MKSILINVGDEKGELLRRRPPRQPGPGAGAGHLLWLRLAPGSLGFLFVDQDKGAYLPDLQSILDRGWLHRGSIVVADNILVPGAPRYREFMNQQHGKLLDTVEHKTHGEYQTLVPDVVMESEYLSG